MNCAYKKYIGAWTTSDSKDSKVYYSDSVEELTAQLRLECEKYGGAISHWAIYGNPYMSGDVVISEGVYKK